MATRLEELLPLLARLAEVDGELRSLADLAAEDGRSTFHLQRIFSAEVGESPLQFSRRVRLQRAAASLLVTQKSVLEVALDAGFDSPEGFSRAFRARFGIAPREFREQRGVFHELVRQYRTHLDVANRTAPCVGLYRVSLVESTTATTPGNKPGGQSDMSYEVEKKKSPETPFLYMKNKAKQEDLAEALGSCFGPVFQYATSKGLAFAGRPTARYTSYGPGLITIEAGMPVAGPAEGEGDIQLGTLGGCDVAMTVHKGPYDTLNLAHEAIEKWLRENGLEASGAPWEVYVSDPGEVPDPKEWITEVVWPLAV